MLWRECVIDVKKKRKKKDTVQEGIDEGVDKEDLVDSMRTLGIYT